MGNHVSFSKMHGLGNDFVMIDQRGKSNMLSERQIVAICDRHVGIGCDQLVLIQDAEKQNHAARVLFYNPDGSLSASCGNASRCIGWYLMEQLGTDNVLFETSERLLSVERVNNTVMRVNMGQPSHHWQDIPLAEASDTSSLPIEYSPLLKNPVAVSMGNPHAVFFVEALGDINVAEAGPALEHHHLFPQRANISFAQITGADQITARVWERGAGETLACGTGACAIFVAAHLRGLVGKEANIILPGGVLRISWQGEELLMEGGTAFVAQGELSEAWLEARG